MDIKHATQPEGSYAQGNALAELHVNMSNILVRAAHGLTLSEKRLMACCVAQLDSMRIGRRPGFDQLRVKLTALDFAETYEIDPKVAYRDMIVASDNLFKRYIRYVEDTPKGKQETKFHWVSGVKYHHGEGWVELGFSPEITPHLMLLRREYTSYKLKTTAALRSTYSWRLYELFVSVWNKKKHAAMTGELYITLDDLCRAMDVPERYKWHDTRKRAIEPAVRELADQNNLKIDWMPVKKGRAVSSLVFYFEEESQKRLDL
jgi:plasmid replication initiation protein